MKLKVRDVVVKLGSREILKNVTFEVGEGELVALLGPNGSGKSTMLRTIYGVLKPVHGVVLFDGRQVVNVEDAARNFGYLPQETPTTNLKVIDIVLLGRTPYMSGFRRPSREDYDVAMNTLQEVGLGDFSDRNFSELSGGERQKVMLARIFAQQPKIMLLDEPTAHLDISAQIEIMEIVRRKVENGGAAIVAIHDVNLASSFATSIIMVKDGRVVYAGDVEEVITEDSIRDVFGAEVRVKRYGKGVYVIPKFRPVGGERKVKVHVICGGGSGKNIMYSLAESGFRISAGVVNVLDTDWEVASEIGEVVDEAPFSQIGNSAHEKNLRCIEKADVVVLANLSVGWGNYRNLLAAKYAAELGKLVVVNETPFEQRNFAGEEAVKIYTEITEQAVVVTKEGDVVDAIRKLLG